jgi:hypothetical protein
MEIPDPQPAESPTPIAPETPELPEPGPAEAPPPETEPVTPEIDPAREAPIGPPVPSEPSVDPV